MAVKSQEDLERARLIMESGHANCFAPNSITSLVMSAHLIPPPRASDPSPAPRPACAASQPTLSPRERAKIQFTAILRQAGLLFPIGGEHSLHGKRQIACHETSTRLALPRLRYNRKGAFLAALWS